MEIVETAWLAVYGALTIIVRCPGYQIDDHTALVERMIHFVLKAADG